MNTSEYPAAIRPIASPPADADLKQLSELLIETVRSGGVVSFLDSLTPQAAHDWWRQTLTTMHPRGLVLVAQTVTEPSKILGTVQLHPAWAPNQPQRAEVVKLMVHPHARGLGIAKRLMQSLEQHAADAGFTLLTLDTKTGTPAERLYESLGWTRAGVIPRFALDPDGQTHHDATIFYKHLQKQPA